MSLSKKKKKSIYTEREEWLTKLAMNSSLGLGTVPLDLLVRERPGGDGAGQMQRMFLDSGTERSEFGKLMGAGNHISQRRNWPYAA